VLCSVEELPIACVVVVLCGKRCDMAVFGNSWNRMEGCLIGGRGMAVGGSSSFEPLSFSSLS